MWASAGSWMLSCSTSGLSPKGMVFFRTLGSMRIFCFSYIIIVVMFCVLVFLALSSRGSFFVHFPSPACSAIFFCTILLSHIFEFFIEILTCRWLTLHPPRAVVCRLRQTRGCLHPEGTARFTKRILERGGRLRLNIPVAGEEGLFLPPLA